MQGLQLPLGVQLSDTASFDSYYAGPNDEAVAALNGLLAPGGPPLLWLFGPKGCGKTHLLQALTRHAAYSAGCAYVPLHELGADALEGLDQADVVCLDDVDAALGASAGDYIGVAPAAALGASAGDYIRVAPAAVLSDAHWPLVLLRFLDQLRAHGGRCVMSASAPPERLAVALPDLKTRFSAAAIYGLKPLTDDDRGRLLRERASARGLELPDEAARYLLARLPRGAGDLLQALDALDRASLSAQRRLTLPFVQLWLRQTAAGPEKPA